MELICEFSYYLFIYGIISPKQFQNIPKGIENFRLFSAFIQVENMNALNAMHESTCYCRTNRFMLSESVHSPHPSFTLSLFPAHLALCKFIRISLKVYPENFNQRWKSSNQWLYEKTNSASARRIKLTTRNFNPWKSYNPWKQFAARNSFESIFWLIKFSLCRWSADKVLM